METWYKFFYKGTMSFIFKISPPVYLRTIKIGIMYIVENNLRKSVKILISEQYFTLLEWFLLTISKKYIFNRSTNLRSRNHSLLCF